MDDDAVILEQITVISTLEADATSVAVDVPESCSFYDAHAMLSIALASLDHIFAERYPNEDDD